GAAAAAGRAVAGRDAGAALAGFAAGARGAALADAAGAPAAPAVRTPAFAAGWEAARVAFSARRSSSHFWQRTRNEVTSVRSALGVKVVPHFSQFAMAGRVLGGSGLGAGTGGPVPLAQTVLEHLFEADRCRPAGRLQAPRSALKPID